LLGVVVSSHLAATVGQEYTVSNLSSGLRGDEHLSGLTAPQAVLVEHGLSGSAKNHQPDRSVKPDKQTDQPNETDHTNKTRA
jgi:hypothetical protein